MTGPATGTLTRTTTITMVDVRHVLWRIQSDLRALRAYHHMITAEREEQITADIAAFVYRNYIETAEFIFVDPKTQTASMRVKYALSRDRADSRDDNSGGLQYQDLTGTDFMVVIAHSPNWWELAAADQKAFMETLQCAWGPVDPVADGIGHWTSDRNYGSGALGAARATFRAV